MHHSSRVLRTPHRCHRRSRVYSLPVTKKPRVSALRVAGLYPRVSKCSHGVLVWSGWRETPGKWYAFLGSYYPCEQSILLSQHTGESDHIRGYQER